MLLIVACERLQHVRKKSVTIFLPHISKVLFLALSVTLYRLGHGDECIVWLK